MGFEGGEYSLENGLHTGHLSRPETQLRHWTDSTLAALRRSRLGSRDRRRLGHSGGPASLRSILRRSTWARGCAGAPAGRLGHSHSHGQAARPPGRGRRLLNRLKHTRPGVALRPSDQPMTSARSRAGTPFRQRRRNALCRGSLPSSVSRHAATAERRGCMRVARRVQCRWRCGVRGGGALPCSCQSVPGFGRQRAYIHMRPAPPAPAGSTACASGTGREGPVGAGRAAERAECPPPGRARSLRARRDPRAARYKPPLRPIQHACIG